MRSGTAQGASRLRAPLQILNETIDELRRVPRNAELLTAFGSTAGSGLMGIASHVRVSFSSASPFSTQPSVPSCSRYERLLSGPESV